MKKRFITFYNQTSNKAVVVDLNLQRLRRMQRAVYSWSDIVSGVTGKFAMYSLTYSPGEKWEPLQISKFMLDVRKYFGSRLLGYAWVAELQERGAVHYHVLLRLTGGFIPKPDVMHWWEHGSSTVTWEVRSAGYYITTYVGKEHQKLFHLLPSGCRCFATWISETDLRIQDRYNRLSLADKMIVDTDGWQNLKFFKSMYKALRREILGAWEFGCSTATKDYAVWMAEQAGFHVESG